MSGTRGPLSTRGPLDFVHPCPMVFTPLITSRSNFLENSRRGWSHRQAPTLSWASLWNTRLPSGQPSRPPSKRPHRDDAIIAHAQDGHIRGRIVSFHHDHAASEPLTQIPPAPIRIIAAHYECVSFALVGRIEMCHGSVQISYVSRLVTNRQQILVLRHVPPANVYTNCDDVIELASATVVQRLQARGQFGLGTPSDVLSESELLPDFQLDLLEIFPRLEESVEDHVVTSRNPLHRRLEYGVRSLSRNVTAEWSVYICSTLHTGYYNNNNPTHLFIYLFIHTYLPTYTG